MCADRTGASEHGATATEYVFLLALLALVAAIGITAYGGTLGAFFDDSAQEVEAATTGS